MSNPPSSRFLAYCAAICVAAASLFYIAARANPIVPSANMLLLLVATVVAESLAVSLPSGGSASISYPLSLAALLLFGAAAGGVVAAFSGVTYADLRDRRPAAILVFNVSQLTFSAVASGLLYQGLGGRVLLAPSTGPAAGFDPGSFSRLLLPLLALSLSSGVLNSVVAGVGIALLRRLSLSEMWAAGMSWVVPNQLALAPVGISLAQVIALVGPIGLGLFVVPLIVARQMYQRYVGLRSMYSQTIRSLTAAIEAKDEYTRGHSERVARYAVAVASGLRLSRREVENIELAALLHDLGKTGIRRSVLSRAGSLRSDEFAEIRTHPSIGATILESVAFLQSIVPVVLHHHERFDGLGYQGGLSATSIPLGARILAVADSFDAMTSERPYRKAMSHVDAVSELVANAGTQFDAQVVSAFLVWLDSEGPDGVRNEDLETADAAG